MSRARIIQERRRRMARRRYDHQAELARIHRWLRTHPGHRMRALRVDARTVSRNNQPMDYNSSLTVAAR